MMAVENIVRALRGSVGVAEFIVTQRRVDELRRHVGTQSSLDRRREQISEAQLFVDRRQGRGQSRLQLLEEQALPAQIRDASVRALASIGPSWRLQPPAAPARVTVSDRGWQHAPAEIIESALEQFISHLPSDMRALELDLVFSRDSQETVVSTGLHGSFERTLLAVSAKLQKGTARPIPVQWMARRQADLAWQEGMQRASRLSLDYQDAKPLEASAVDVLLLADAYAPTAIDDYGIWTAIVEQCSAELFRHGMARYGLGQAITPVPASGDTLGASSDGTIDYALHSAPFSSDGQAVRRFPLVQQGLAAGHAIDHREAALAGMSANGGVRNLSIAGGSKSLEELMIPGGRPLLIVERVAQVQASPRGSLLLQIDCARSVRKSATGPQEERTRGGVLSGDIYQWLEHAYYSREMHSSPGYRGPKGIRFDGLWVQS